MDGKPRRRLAALQAGDGALLPWNIGASAVVRALSWNGDDLWVGGRSRRSAVSSAVASPPSDRGRPDAGWDAAANGNVESLAVIGETVYVAGPFTSIGGRSRKHLGALDAVDGTATRWDPAPDDVVRALLPAPDETSWSSRAISRGSGGRRDVASFELASGYVTDWRPVAPFSGLALAFGDAGMVFVAGEGAIAVFRWPPLL